MGVWEGVVVPSWCLCWAMLGAKWIQDGFKRRLNPNFSPNLASCWASWRQDGKIKPPKMGPGWSDLEELGATWRKLGEVGSAGGGGVVQQGGGSKDPRVGF